MAIKVIAQRRVLKIGKTPGVKKFVMRPDLYIPVQEKKVFAEASRLGCCRRGHPHMGYRGSLRPAAWTGHYALRCPLEGGGGSG